MAICDNSSASGAASTTALWARRSKARGILSAVARASSSVVYSPTQRSPSRSCSAMEGATPRTARTQGKEWEPTRAERRSNASAESRSHPSSSNASAAPTSAPSTFSTYLPKPFAWRLRRQVVLPEPSAPTSSTRRIPSRTAAWSDETASACRRERGGAGGAPLATGAIEAGRREEEGADDAPPATGAIEAGRRGPPSREMDSPAHAEQMKAPAGPATSCPTSPRGLQQNEHQAGASGSDSEGARWANSGSAARERRFPGGEASRVIPDT